jgi:hypothetical protein
MSTNAFRAGLMLIVPLVFLISESLCLCGWSLEKSFEGPAS